MVQYYIMLIINAFFSFVDFWFILFILFYFFGKTHNTLQFFESLVSVALRVKTVMKNKGLLLQQLSGSRQLP